MRDHHPLFHVLLAIVVIASTAPTISAASNLSPTRNDPSDIEISGHFIAVGFLPWREGLTLGDALDETEGFREFAYLVYITPEDWDTKDLLPSAMTKIAPEKLGAGSEQRGILLRKGDRIYAAALFPATSDPAPVIKATNQILAFFKFNQDAPEPADESPAERRLRRKLSLLSTDAFIVQVQWTVARRNRDREDVRMNSLRQTQETLVEIEKCLPELAALLPKIKIESDPAILESSAELLRSEIQKYRTAISASFP